jgi:hypothetical protein
MWSRTGRTPDSLSPCAEEFRRLQGLAVPALVDDHGRVLQLVSRVLEDEPTGELVERLLVIETGTPELLGISRRRVPLRKSTCPLIPCGKWRPDPISRVFCPLGQCERRSRPWLSPARVASVQPSTSRLGTNSVARAGARRFRIRGPGREGWSGRFDRVAGPNLTRDPGRSALGPRFRRASWAASAGTG